MIIERLRPNQGFTLIEILVAIVILTVALLGMAAVTVMVMKGNTVSRNITTATTLVKDKMESLKNTSYVNIVSGGPETVQSIFSRTWVVTNNSPAPNMKTISVTVTWEGQVRSVTLNTLVANPNPI